MIEIVQNSPLLQLPEKKYGTIKRVGMFNNEPILYGDINQVKPGSLFYLASVKQVYRYIKPDAAHVDLAHMKFIKYYFDTIKPTTTDGLLVPEEERGHIRNAGYLFNEIIYCGDPNLVENGSLFYHDTLPYISIVSNVDGIINLSTKEMDEEGEITTVITEYRVSPERDYSKDYLTFETLEDGTFTLNVPSNVDSTYMTSVSYSIDNGATWNTTTIDNTAQTITTPTIASGSKVLWKGVGKQMSKSTTSNNFSYFSSTGNFNVCGNIMSLLYEDNFQNSTSFNSNSNYNFASIFKNATKLTDVVKLILPATTLANRCYAYMFQDCTSLTAASELPATTLAENCYEGMFATCTSLTTAPELPATTLASNCYHQMFYGCSKLNYIKAMFTVMLLGATDSWVSNVAAQGTFVKNVNATWNTTGANGVPTGWTVETAEPEPSDEITI